LGREEVRRLIEACGKTAWQVHALCLTNLHLHEGAALIPLPRTLMMASRRCSSRKGLLIM
jgi:hypothetical protein